MHKHAHVGVSAVHSMPADLSVEQSTIPTHRICGNPWEPAEFNPQNEDWQNFYSVGVLFHKDRTFLMWIDIFTCLSTC